MTFCLTATERAIIIIISNYIWTYKYRKQLEEVIRQELTEATVDYTESSKHSNTETAIIVSYRFINLYSAAQVRDHSVALPLRKPQEH